MNLFCFFDINFLTLKKTFPIDLLNWIWLGSSGPNLLTSVVNKIEEWTGISSRTRLTSQVYYTCLYSVLFASKNVELTENRRKSPV